LTLALYSFFNFVLWQMPHFYSIAIYRAYKDYAASGCLFCRFKKGVKNHQNPYSGIYNCLYYCGASLTYFKFAGWTYLIITNPAWPNWLWLG